MKSRQTHWALATLSRKSNLWRMILVLYINSLAKRVFGNIDNTIYFLLNFEGPRDKKTFFYRVVLLVYSV